MPSAWPASPPCSPRPTRRVIDERAPLGAATTTLAGGHDAVETDLERAARAYGDAAAGYDRLGPRLDAMETSLDALAGTVSKVSGAAKALPGHVDPPGRDAHGDDQGRAGHPRHDGGIRRVTELAVASRRRSRDGHGRDEVRRPGDGLPLRLTLGGPAGSRAPSDAVAAWSAVVDEFEAAEAAMSRFRDDSELTGSIGAPARARPCRSRRGSAGRWSRRIVPGGSRAAVSIHASWPISIASAIAGRRSVAPTPRPPVRTPALWRDRDPTSASSSSSVVAASLSAGRSTWVASGRA